MLQLEMKCEKAPRGICFDGKDDRNVVILASKAARKRGNQGRVTQKVAPLETANDFINYICLKISAKSSVFCKEYRVN